LKLRQDFIDRAHAGLDRFGAGIHAVNECLPQFQQFNILKR